MLRKTLVAIILFVSAPAIAQDMTAEQRAAAKAIMTNSASAPYRAADVSSRVYPSRTTSSQTLARRSSQRLKSSELSLVKTLGSLFKFAV